MKGYYICEFCNSCIRVNTMFLQHSGSSRVGRANIKICPHCGREKIKEINASIFYGFDYSVFLNVYRFYSFQKIGKRKLNLSIKYVWFITYSFNININYNNFVRLLFNCVSVSSINNYKIIFEETTMKYQIRFIRELRNNLDIEIVNVNRFQYYMFRKIIKEVSKKWKKELE